MLRVPVRPRGPHRVGGMAAGERRFTGFGPKALDFFKALGFHQSKEWFDENRALYETEVKAPLVALVEDLSAALHAKDIPLHGSARSVFRLNRDIRFSKDKRPYKSNGGAVLSRDGTKRSPGLLYIHVAPDGCFVASGFWQPEPEALLAMRRAIADDPKAFRRLARQLGEAGLSLSDGDALKRAPRGFEHVEDEAAAAGLRRRSLIVREDLRHERLHDGALVDDIVAFAERAAPLLRFGWKALG
jgi:uncharacterized protein (TIGR02453 family)